MLVKQQLQHSCSQLSNVVLLVCLNALNKQRLKKRAVLILLHPSISDY